MVISAWDLWVASSGRPTSNLVIGRRGTFALSPNIFTTGSPIREGNVLTNS